MLAGGVGGSRFVLGVRGALRARGIDDTAAALTVVVNTGDDLGLSGVRLQPDVDSITYALAGVNDTERGWGREGDTERVNRELQEWDAGWPWFTLGDLDLGTHLARTGWLREGLTPTQVLERMSRLQVTYDYAPNLVLQNFEVLKGWQDEALEFGQNDQPVES